MGRIAPALSHWDVIDALREEHRYFWNEKGKYWVLTRQEDILEAGHDAELFSNHSIIPTEPNPDYRFLPSHLDPPDHLKYRQVMNTWFAPKRIARNSEAIRAHAAKLAAEIAPNGACDFMTAFGDLFPIRALLSTLGLPIDDGPMLVERVRRRNRLRATGDYDAAMAAWHEMETYWKAIIDDRRATPRDPDVDYVTQLLRSTIDDAPLSEPDMVDILVTLTVGGVDTMKAQLGWCIYHLATHADDLARLMAEPDLLPNAIEEFLRAYPVIGMGRKVTRDADFHGCPMRKDDMVLLSYPSACRDPRRFPDAAHVDITRENNRHVTFGSSLHRCLGSHLARAELQIAVQEWLRAVPEFRMASDEPPMAMGGQIALLELPIVWTFPTE